MHRKLFTTREWLASGKTKAALYWAERAKRVVRVDHGVFAEGSEPADPLTMALARLIASQTMATGAVAGALYGLDAVDNATLVPPSRRRAVMFGGAPALVDGVCCASGLQTIVELAALLDDLRWEQALEAALRKRLFRLAELEALLPELSASRTHGSPRIRRVLALRPPDAPPTESLLETLMVQLARATPGVPEPARQVEVRNEDGGFVARVDLAWPDPGAFGELDGMQHPGQPVYDASRETAVVAATGWLCARFTWRQVRYNPVPTGRQLVAVLDQARRRRSSAA